MLTLFLVPLIMPSDVPGGLARWWCAGDHSGDESSRLCAEQWGISWFKADCPEPEHLGWFGMYC